jgi:hypothetical protein
MPPPEMHSPRAFFLFGEDAAVAVADAAAEALSSLVAPATTIEAEAPLVALLSPPADDIRRGAELGRTTTGFDSVPLIVSPSGDTLALPPLEPSAVLPPMIDAAVPALRPVLGALVTHMTSLPTPLVLRCCCCVDALPPAPAAEEAEEGDVLPLPLLLAAAATAAAADDA